MRFVNLKGDLFATAFSVGGASLIRLASALVLTRLLYPEAYGIVAMVSAVGVVFEVISDLGVPGFVIRDKNAELRRYLNTLWTVRLVRGCINFAIVFACAPLIAKVYGTPLLTEPLRIYSLSFLFMGLESMSFPLAIRHQRARVLSYSELLAAFVSTCFVIGFSYYSRDHMGMIYGMLLNRALLAALSYAVQGDFRPKLQLDRGALRDLFRYSKYVMPSSMTTLAANQFDKIVFLRLFDLHLFGLYGLAGNVAAPVNGLITTVTRRVLYPRCARAYRSEPESLRAAYYAQNVKLFIMVMALPAALAGAADFIVEFLFDERYAGSGMILQAFMLQSVLLSAAALAEQPLVAAGYLRVILVSNLVRLGWMVVATLLGFHFWGFPGFLYGYASSAIPAAAYNLWMQQRAGLMVVRYELMKIAFVFAVFSVSLLIGHVLSGLGLTVQALNAR